MFQFLHAADFHLDSAFASLSPEQAASRRRESRELPKRLAEYANSHGVDLVLLSGDLLDSDGGYRETHEALRLALGSIQAPVFLAPGNHDWYGTSSPYASLNWPENVHIFRSNTVESVELPALRTVIHGAAFTGPEQTESLLAGFVAPDDGKFHLMALHGELNAAEPRYNPLTRDEIAASGLNYLALGHIHKRTDPLKFGKTTVAWPGCPEGRGFDELGDKGIYAGTVSDDGAVSLSFVPLARHRYEILTVDVTGQTPDEAFSAVLPQDTQNDLYRILLTGETDAAGMDLAALREKFSDRFEALELRDETRLREDIWTKAGEDSLRGLFLQSLRMKLDAAQTDGERKMITSAARLGLAALDHRDLG